MADTPRILIIGCKHSAGVAIADLRSRQQELPANVEWIGLPCGGSLDVLYLLRAFEQGADQVMVLGCYDGACNSLDGSRWAAKRVDAARALLEEAGIAGWRLQFQQISPAMGTDLLQWLEAFREPAPEESEPTNS